MASILARSRFFHRFSEPAEKFIPVYNPGTVGFSKIEKVENVGHAVLPKYQMAKPLMKMWIVLSAIISSQTDSHGGTSS